MPESRELCMQYRDRVTVTGSTIISSKFYKYSHNIIFSNNSSCATGKNSLRETSIGCFNAERHIHLYTLNRALCDVPVSVSDRKLHPGACVMELARSAVMMVVPSFVCDGVRCDLCVPQRTTRDVRLPDANANADRLIYSHRKTAHRRDAANAAVDAAAVLGAGCNRNIFKSRCRTFPVGLRSFGQMVGRFVCKVSIPCELAMESVHAYIGIDALSFGW